MNDKQFNFSKIPNHLHNGTDTNKIEEINLIKGKQYYVFLIENVSEIFTVSGIPDLTSINFTGIAYDSSASPATKKASLNGYAIYGLNYTLTGSGVTFDTQKDATSVIDNQGTSAIYIDTSSLTKTTVSTSGQHLAYVVNDLGVVVASLTATYDIDKVITFTAVVAANWILKGNLTFN